MKFWHGFLALSLGWALAQPLALSGDTGAVHDPSIVEAGGKFYVFSTGRGIPVRCSDDLLAWTQCRPVMFGMPDWIRQEVPAVDQLWAPDISYFGGRYQVYYAASSFGDNQSAIGLATSLALDSSSPDYGWQDQGLVIKSEHDDDYNAIDPNFVVDRSGQPWLVFGSFWSGIKLVRLDPETGKPASADPELRALARRPAPGAIEAPFLIYRQPYYYLFVSFDQCCRGVDSTYNIRVGRAQDITGPYADRDGVAMLEGGGSLILAGGERWRGPGHNAVLHTGGRDLLVYHSYDVNDHGRPYLRIEPLIWDDEGWPGVAPR